MEGEGNGEERRDISLTSSIQLAFEKLEFHFEKDLRVGEGKGRERKGGRRKRRKDEKEGRKGGREGGNRPSVCGVPYTILGSTWSPVVPLAQSVV